MSEGHKFKVLEYIKRLIYRVSMADFCFFMESMADYFGRPVMLSLLFTMISSIY